MIKRDYYGIGVFNGKEDEKTSKCFKEWVKMIKEVYDSRDRVGPVDWYGRPVDVGTVGIEEWEPECRKLVIGSWSEYEAFKDWWDENYVEIPFTKDQLVLDRRIIETRNIKFNSEYCRLVPKSVHDLITPDPNLPAIEQRMRGIKVINNEARGRLQYKVYITISGKPTHIGTYDDEIVAIMVREQAIENYINMKSRELYGIATFDTRSAMTDYRITPHHMDLKVEPIYDNSDFFE